MTTKVQKWGNSLALRILRPLAVGANVSAGTTVDIELRERKLIVERTAAPHYDLDDLQGRTRALLPVTGERKGYPYEVEIPTGQPITGVILSDQLKSLDWRARKAEHVCPLPSDTLLDALAKIRTLTA